MRPSIKYLGHIYSGDGLRPDFDKIKAVAKSLTPASQEQLESFLGLVKYYNSHVSNLSSLAGIFNKLRRIEVSFLWTPLRLSAYKVIKTNYQAFVFSHRTPNCLIFTLQRTPLSMDSKRCCFTNIQETSSTCILNLGYPYLRSATSVTHRELVLLQSATTLKLNNALAIIFGVKMLEKYLMKRHFKMYTYHKPLVQLFDFLPATSFTNAAIIQHWSL